MSKKKMLIGRDITIDGDVYVEAHNGQVSVVGPFEGWMGFAVLADLDDFAEGDALAHRIADNPVDELAALGYETGGWFRP